MPVNSGKGEKMKKIVLLLIGLLVLLLAGCASQKAYDGYLASFDKTAAGYNTAATKPLLAVELPSPVKGKPYKITVNREVKRIVPSQIKDSEWVTPVVAGLNVFGGVTNNAVNRHYGSKDIESITKMSGGGISTGGGAVTIKDAYNKTSVVSAGSAATSQGSSEEVVFEPEQQPESEE